MGTKLRLEIKGLDELNARITKLGGNTKMIAEKALKETHAYITPKIHAAMKPHNRTGETEGQIIDQATIEWAGTVATLKAGFDLSKGMTPIYLMEGTKAHVITHRDPRGTPRRHPGTRFDSKLKSAARISSNRSKIIKIQEDVFYNYIRELGG